LISFRGWMPPPRGVTRLRLLRRATPGKRGKARRRGASRPSDPSFLFYYSER
jgi:hypothetical protein